MNNYDDIINLPHHVSKTRRPMPIANRAAQFAPFAALSGHDDAITETARLTSDKIELSRDEHCILSNRLALAVEKHAEVTITYFKSDSRKTGGCYLTTSGRIKKVDHVEKRLLFGNGTAIKLDDLISIEGEIFNNF